MSIETAIHDCSPDAQADDYPLEIGQHTFEPIPERWIEQGVDADAVPDAPTLYAVSYAGTVDSKAVIVRYSHPTKPGVIRTSTGRAVVDGSVEPVGLAHGRWPRTYVPAPGVGPTDHIRLPEIRHLRDLWGDRIDEIPSEEDLENLLANGGLPDAVADIQQTSLREWGVGDGE